MAAFVSSFAQRYGRGGSFWSQHPELPYLPVESYEIGNEPDITPTAPADETSLHYADPASYALVYQAARAALHQVDPAAQAVVGGMLDSGAIGLADAERYLSAVGPMDAVGYHPYLYDVRRGWSRHGRAAAVAGLQRPRRQYPSISTSSALPAGVTAGSAAWGAQVAQYTQWALCTSSLLVENVQAFWWGAVALANTSPWFAMVDSALSQTPLGTAYLGEVSALTTQGCPAVAPAPSTTTRCRADIQARQAPQDPEAGEALHRRKRRRPVKASHGDTWQHRLPGSGGIR